MAAPTTAARNYQPTTTATKYQPIHTSSSNSSYVRSLIWKCVRWNRRKLFWSTKHCRRRKQLYIKQLLFTGSRKGKNQSEKKSCLPSSHPLQTLKIILMWSCLLSYLDSFQLFGIQSLTVLKSMWKRKTLGTKLMLLLVGVFINL